MQSTLRYLIKKQRQKLTPGQRKASRNKAFYWKYPFAVENALARKLKSKFKPIAIDVLTKYLQWEKQYKPKIKIDAEEDFILWMETKRAELKKEFDSDKIWGILALLFLGNTIDGVAVLNLSEFERYLLQFISDQFPVEITDWISYRRDFAMQLRGRILGNIDLYFNRVESLYYKWQSGELTLSQFSNEMNRVTKFYAIQKMEYVSRDLIGTLNEKIQRNIQQQLGIDTYLWQTMQDERVRGTPGGLYPNAIPSHFIMNGLICSWSRPDSFSTDGIQWQPKSSRMELLHAGEASGCRCIPGMWIVNDLREIDKEITNGSRDL